MEEVVDQCIKDINKDLMIKFLKMAHSFAKEADELELFKKYCLQIAEK